MSFFNHKKKLGTQWSNSLSGESVRKVEVEQHKEVTSEYISEDFAFFNNV